MRPINVEVWWADPTWLQTWHMEILNREERARALRYRRDSDRANFVVAAALLRLVAGRKLDLSPSAVPVHRRCAECGAPHGRPKIIDAGFSVSIAHSAQRVMLGLTADGTVGVDVEQVRAIDVNGLRPLVLAAAELPAKPTRNDFFSTWVRKEAVLKAVGTGLDSMTSVVLGPADATPFFVTIGGRPRPDLLLADVDAGAEYAAAVATISAWSDGPGAVGNGPPAITIETYRNEAAAMLRARITTRSSGEQPVR